MSTWKPFTERARRSIVLAQEEAQRLGNSCIGTEHILLGIISEGESFAANVIGMLGVNLAKARQEVEAIAGCGGQIARQEMVFAPCAKRVMDVAAEEAGRLDHSYTGTEHLLLGLIRKHDGVVARILANLGVDPADVRAMLLPDAGRTPASKGKSTRSVTFFAPMMLTISDTSLDKGSVRAIVRIDRGSAVPTERRPISTGLPSPDPSDWWARFGRCLDSVPLALGQLEHVVLRLLASVSAIGLVWTALRLHP